MMAKGDPSDRLFYYILALMIASYNVLNKLKGDMVPGGLGVQLFFPSHSCRKTVHCMVPIHSTL